MTKHKYDCIGTLCRAGFSHDDATALRRISMTLHRWHEHECIGDIQRDESNGFAYRHYGVNMDKRYKTADKETGALKHLSVIMARYPGFTSYVQGYPRGCALYILRHNDVPEGQNTDGYYSRGLAVY